MPADLTCVATAEGGRLPALAGFLAAYAALLATPGPNLLAVGSIAALRGLRGAWPLCLGLGFGAAGLNAALLLLSFSLADAGAGWERVGQAVGALVLMGVAVGVARLPLPATADAPSRPATAAEDVAALGAGFLTAATNPLSGAFFAVRHMGCVGAAPDPAALALAVLGVFALALGATLGAAAMLARPGARRAALAWYRPIRLGAAAALLLLSANALRAALG